jgi:hypothetical protein
LDKITGIPSEQRRELIHRIVDALIGNSNITQESCKTLWYLLRRIEQDVIPCSKYDDYIRTAGVRAIKNSDPELYNSIVPWTTFVKQEKE